MYEGAMLVIPCYGVPFIAILFSYIIVFYLRHNLPDIMAVWKNPQFEQVPIDYLGIP